MVTELATVAVVTAREETAPGQEAVLPLHDAWVRRDFIEQDLKRRWLAVTTKRDTAENERRRLVKDACARRVVGRIGRLTDPFLAQCRCAVNGVLATQTLRSANPLGPRQPV